MEFKLLGGTDPPNQSLGDMYQGIGFPLHPVEPAISGGDVTVKTENVLSTASFIDQDPIGLGVALQVTFGAAGDSTPEWSVNANGELTCLEADEYTLLLKIQIGRTGGGGEAQIYNRLLINGAPIGNTVHAIVDNARIEIPLNFQQAVAFDIGDILTFEIIRDTDANNSGGLTVGLPDVVGWANSPSAFLQINRNIALIV